MDPDRLPLPIDVRKRKQQGELPHAARSVLSSPSQTATVSVPCKRTGNLEGPPGGMEE